MAKDSHATLMNQLKEAFDPRLVKWRQGGGGKQLAYIDARDVMKRLDDVMGVAGWSDKYTYIDGGVICELSLNLSADPANPQWVTKSNGANYTKIEPVKGGISTALKRAAVEWGIGRYLYYLDPNKFNSRNTDSWPFWAKPGDKKENWEDVAELEADASFGMDEEESFEAGINVTLDIQGAKTLDELKKIVDGIDGNTQRLLVDVIANKTDELTRG